MGDVNEQANGADPADTADPAVSAARVDGAPAPPAAAGRRPSAAKTLRDMVWSLAVVFLAIGFVLLVTWRPAPDPVRVVDVAPPLAAARAAADYPVLAPERLGDDWRATSARWEPTAATGDVPAWHLGMVAPDDTYVQVSQAATTDPDYVAEQAGGGAPDGTSTVAGVTYDRLAAADQRSLVRVEDGVTTIVTGTASWETLEAFAGALQGG